MIAFIKSTPSLVFGALVAFLFAGVIEAHACRCAKVSNFFDHSQSLFSGDEAGTTALVIATADYYLNKSGKVSFEKTRDADTRQPDAEFVNFVIHGVAKGTTSFPTQLLLPFGESSCSTSPYAFDLNQTYLMLVKVTPTESGNKAYRYAGYACAEGALSVQSPRR